MCHAVKQGGDESTETLLQPLQATERSTRAGFDQQNQQNNIHTCLLHIIYIKLILN